MCQSKLLVICKQKETLKMPEFYLHTDLRVWLPIPPKKPKTCVQNNVTSFIAFDIFFFAMDCLKPNIWSFNITSAQ